MRLLLKDVISGVNNHIIRQKTVQSLARKVSVEGKFGEDVGFLNLVIWGILLVLSSR